jgi:hypothetical protein
VEAIEDTVLGSYPQSFEVPSKHSYTQEQRTFHYKPDGDWKSSHDAVGYLVSSRYMTTPTTLVPLYDIEGSQRRYEKFLEDHPDLFMRIMDYDFKVPPTPVGLLFACDSISEPEKPHLSVLEYWTTTILSAILISTVVTYILTR